MAEAVAMNVMYLRLGFSVSAALMLHVDQGMENLDELELLDDTEVEVLCKLVRRPGGHTVNPNAARAGQPEFIPAWQCYLYVFFFESQTRLFFICHYKRTSRAMIPANVLLLEIRALRAQRLLEMFKETPVTVLEIVERTGRRR